MSSERRKNPVKTSTIVKIVVIAVLVAAAVTAAVFILKNRVSSMSTKDDSDIQSAQVTTGAISTTVSGSGQLANEDSEDVFISATVDVTEIYVKAGDNVVEGDMLASVNSASVVKAMKEIQDDIDDIDDEIADLEEEDITTKLTANVSGRVKKIYAEVGQNVADVIYENKALMLISVDGYMAIDLETDALSKGDTVTVTDENGTEYTGTVDAVWAGTATILVPDDTIACDAAVTVSKDGTSIGSGTAYIHEQVAVTGFTGVISKVNVKENDKVKANKAVIEVTDVSSTVNYSTLLEKRADLEDELNDLIAIYKEGAVYAKTNGMVTAISETEDDTTTTTTASTRNSAFTYTTVTEDTESEDGTTISICPTDTMTIDITVDETDILSLEVGQEADVTIDALNNDTTYTGTVTDIDTTGSSSSGVTSYTATITIDKVTGMLSGMTADVTVTIEGKDDALLIPVDALHKTSSTYYVYTTYDEESGEFGGMVEVTVGLSNSKYAEITSGLKAGDTVWYTEEEEQFSFSFGGMSGFSGGSSGFSGGSMGGGMGGGSGSGNRGGGNMPGGGF